MEKQIEILQGQWESKGVIDGFYTDKLTGKTYTMALESCIIVLDARNNIALSLLVKVWRWVVLDFDSSYTESKKENIYGPLHKTRMSAVLDGKQQMRASIYERKAMVEADKVRRAPEAIS